MIAAARGRARVRRGFPLLTALDPRARASARCSRCSCPTGGRSSRASSATSSAPATLGLARVPARRSSTPATPASSSSSNHAWISALGIRWHRSASTASACSWSRSPRCCSRSACSRRPSSSKREGVHVWMLLLEAAVHRRVPRARPRSSSSSSSSRARADVLPHRGLGPRQPALRGDRSSSSTRWPARRSCSSAILSRRVPAPARHRRTLTFDLRDAHRLGAASIAARTAHGGCSSRFAIALRGQGAAVPVPHVAARRAHRGADRGLGRAGRRAC